MRIYNTIGNSLLLIFIFFTNTGNGNIVITITTRHWYSVFRVNSLKVLDWFWFESYIRPRVFQKKCMVVGKISFQNMIKPNRDPLSISNIIYSSKKQPSGGSYKALKLIHVLINWGAHSILTYIICDKG